MIALADEEITFEHALGHLRDYATAMPATVRFYDYAGDLDTRPEPSDGVQMSDVARLVVINAQLSANDIPALLEPLDSSLWQNVPHEATFGDLPDNPLRSDLYSALVSLYDEYADRKGLGRTKVTKLLHLKRPMLVPILDSVAESAYTATATALAEEFAVGQRLYWAAIWRDARHNSAEMSEVAATLRTGGGHAAALAALSPLRLHDVLVWSHFEPRGGCAARK